MRVTILAFGTRGELQPLTALGLGLVVAGYTVRIVTQTDFYEFVTSRGLECVPIDLDLRELEANRNEEGDYSVFMIIKMARKLMRKLLREIWDACKDAEALILCDDMALIPGWHIMEKLQVPTYITCFFPEEVVVKFWRKGFKGRWATFMQSIGFFFSSTFVLRPFINEWRTQLLGLPKSSEIGRSVDQVQSEGLPMLYAYSPAVFPPLEHWPDWCHVTGYWFLDRPQDWQPPEALVSFLAAGSPPVYVGFSSVSYHDMEAVTDLMLEALKQTGQRGILAAGWSNLGQRPTLPDTVLAIESAPHDWLFPQCAAAIHHGGAGTAATAMRSGIPNIVIPFAFDNPFWAWRIEELGIGLPAIQRKDLTVERLVDTLTIVLNDPDMKQRRRALQSKLLAEDGIARAIEVFEQYLV